MVVHSFHSYFFNVLNTKSMHNNCLKLGGDTSATFKVSPSLWGEFTILLEREVAERNQLNNSPRQYEIKFSTLPIIVIDFRKLMWAIAVEERSEERS